MFEDDGYVKLLQLPAIPNSRDSTIAQATQDVLVEWGCSELTRALVLDTTSSNSGIHFSLIKYL